MSNSYAQENPMDQIGDGLTIFTHSIDEGIQVDKNGDLRGLEGGGRRAVDIEIVRAVKKKIANSQSINIVPFKRGLRKVQTENDTILFNVLRNQEREKTAKWVGPLQIYLAFFYGPKEVAKKVITLEDAKLVNRICLIRGDSGFEKYSKLGFTNLLEVSSKSQCWDLLERGRVDLIAMTNAGENFHNQSTIEFSRSVYQEVGKGYIAFSNNIRDDVINKWQKALDEMKATGEFQQILNKYGTAQ